MSKRILIIAMESDVITSIPITLRLAGHRVFTADCGLDGIKKARGLLPDLIMVDATLPDMDGETLVDILARLPSTANVRSLLLRPRQMHHSPVNGADAVPLHPGSLLPQVAMALELCQDEQPVHWDQEVSDLRLL